MNVRVCQEDAEEEVLPASWVTATSEDVKTVDTEETVNSPPLL